MSQVYTAVINDMYNKHINTTEKGFTVGIYKPISYSQQAAGIGSCDPGMAQSGFSEVKK